MPVYGQAAAYFIPKVFTTSYTSGSSGSQNLACENWCVKIVVINSSLGRKPKMTVINELIDEGKDFVQKEDIAEQ